MAVPDLVSQFFLGGVNLRTQVVAFLGSLTLLFIVVRLIRGEKLKPGYSIGWFVVGFCIVFLSLFSSLLSIFSELLGIAYAPAAFLLVLVSGLFLLALHFSVLVTRYDRQIRDLAQECGLLREQLSRYSRNA